MSNDKGREAWVAHIWRRYAGRGTDTHLRNSDRPVRLDEAAALSSHAQFRPSKTRKAAGEEAQKDGRHTRRVLIGVDQARHLAKKAQAERLGGVLLDLFDDGVEVCLRGRREPAGVVRGDDDGLQM